MSAAHVYTATIRWERSGAVFTDRRYSRAHRWTFDGGIEVAGSSSPLVVRVPLSEPCAIDPEEAFTASVSSCHMLFFLDYAAQASFVVDRYEDTATATMGVTQPARPSCARSNLRRASPSPGSAFRRPATSHRCTTARTTIASSPTPC